MMVNVATLKQQQLVGVGSRSQWSDSLPHTGQTQTPFSVVQYFCSCMRADKLKNSTR